MPWFDDNGCEFCNYFEDATDSLQNTLHRGRIKDGAWKIVVCQEEMA